MLQSEIMDGVVSLEKAGVDLRLHDRRIDHASVSAACDDVATGTLRGNVSLWPRRFFQDKAAEAGILEKDVAVGAGGGGGGGGSSKEVAADSNGEFGASLFRVKKQPFDAMRASTVLTDLDLDVVDSKDVKLNRHLGNGAFGTVREGVLHHTAVAVKILKEGEFRGALGSLAQAGEAEREDIRRGLVRVRADPRLHVNALCCSLLLSAAAPCHAVAEARGRNHSWCLTGVLPRHACITCIHLRQSPGVAEPGLTEHRCGTRWPQVSELRSCVPEALFGGFAVPQAMRLCGYEHGTA